LWLPGGTADAGWRTTWETHEYPYMLTHTHALNI